MRNSISILLVAIMLAMAPITSFAEVPGQISYQGTLNDSTGTPLAGSYSMTFTLYDEADEGNQLWTETHAVPVVNGVFDVVLGSTENNSLSSIEFDGEVYLGLKVGSDLEMEPRQKITSTPFAIHASTADTVGGMPASEILPVGNTLQCIGTNKVIGINSATGDVICGPDTDTNAATKCDPGEILIGDGSCSPLPVGDITGITADGGLVGGGSAGNVTVSIGNDTVTSAHLAPNSVTTSELAHSSVTGGDIQDGSITAADLASNTIDRTKISGEIAVYAVSTGCPNSSAITTSNNCTSAVCEDSSNYYKNCYGSCTQNTSPETCSNSLLGYLLAP